jgi:hypothetical protein
VEGNETLFEVYQAFRCCPLWKPLTLRRCWKYIYPDKKLVKETSGKLQFNANYLVSKLDFFVLCFLDLSAHMTQDIKLVENIEQTDGEL